MRDVARVAGVSHQTVSRVINQHPNLRPETRERVLAAIEELHYWPNPMARALGRNHSRAIGVVASQRSHYGPSAAIRGVESAAAEQGYIVHCTDLETTTPEAITTALGELVGQRVDGIIIVAPQTPTVAALGDLELSLPYVMLHARSANDPHEVFVDQIAGARLATRHLVELGHTRIHHLAGPSEWIESQARRQGFVAEMQSAGLSLSAVTVGDWTADSGFAAGQELLRPGRPTAVFCANDQMALGLLHAALAAGLGVPVDLSIVGFDDIPEARHFWPPLTTVRQDFVELGRRCVAQLLGGAGSTAAPVEAPLIRRSSTAPPVVA